MKKFFECHPGSALGASLFLSRSSLVALTLENPQAAIRVLKNDYGFGQHSDFWDDHIFNLILSPALSRIVELDIKSAVDLYAYIDHELFIHIVETKIPQDFVVPSGISTRRPADISSFSNI